MSTVKSDVPARLAALVLLLSPLAARAEELASSGGAEAPPAPVVVRAEPVQPAPAPAGQAQRVELVVRIVQDAAVRPASAAVQASPQAAAVQVQASPQAPVAAAVQAPVPAVTSVVGFIPTTATRTIPAGPIRRLSGWIGRALASVDRDVQITRVELRRTPVPTQVVATSTAQVVTVPPPPAAPVVSAPVLSPPAKVAPMTPPVPSK
jgi:S-DNA-T family DNA segregation ATPase FtsK/SpoIIIE